MNEVVKLILSLSIIGSVISLLMFALNPVIKRRISKSLQYFLWVVILIKFAFPLPFGINVTKILFDTPTPQKEIITEAKADTIPKEIYYPPTNTTHKETTEKNIITPLFDENNISEKKSFDFLKFLIENTLFIWLTGAFISYFVSIFGYYKFSFRINKTLKNVSVMENEIFNKILNEKNKLNWHKIGIFKSPLTPSPMFIHVFKRKIILPDKDYTPEQLRNILLHELTHATRNDINIKYLAQAVVSMHWFNPLVYLIRREINRMCELSCDEAVIRKMDGAGRKSYGETLIDIAAESRLPYVVLSATMSGEKEKKEIKERLIAVMNYKKKSKSIIIISVVTVVLIISVALFAGAYRNNETPVSKTETEKETENLNTDLIAAEVYAISLENLYVLAEKGKNLRYSDFSDFVGTDIGSGTYILKYSVEGWNTLTVGWAGTGTGDEPFYAVLQAIGSNEAIDLLKDKDIDAYLRRSLSFTEQNKLVNSKLNEICQELFNSKSYDFFKDGNTAYGELYSIGIGALPLLCEVIQNPDNALKKNIAIRTTEDILFDITETEENSELISKTKIILRDYNRKKNPPKSDIKATDDEFSVLETNDSENISDSPSELPLSISFDFPVKDYRITEEWLSYEKHIGIDLSAEKGTEIYAAADGIVSTVLYGENEDPDDFWNSGYGLCVIIEHGNGISTFYAHCSEVLVERGQKVKKGDLIAKIGDTGMAYGTHLHFEYRVDGTPKNPREILDFPENEHIPLPESQSTVIIPVLELNADDISSIELEPSLNPYINDLKRVVTSSEDISKIINYFKSLAFYNDLPSEPIPGGKTVTAYYTTVNFKNDTVGYYIHFGRFFITAKKINNINDKEWEFFEQKMITYEESFAFEDLLNDLGIL